MSSNRKETLSYILMECAHTGHWRAGQKELTHFLGVTKTLEALSGSPAAAVISTPSESAPGTSTLEGARGHPGVPADQVVRVDRVVGAQEGGAHHNLALRPVAHNARHAVHIGACPHLP